MRKLVIRELTTESRNIIVGINLRSRDVKQMQDALSLQRECS